MCTRPGPQAHALAGRISIGVRAHLAGEKSPALSCGINYRGRLKEGQFGSISGIIDSTGIYYLWVCFYLPSPLLERREVAAMTSPRRGQAMEAESCAE